MTTRRPWPACHIGLWALTGLILGSCLCFAQPVWSDDAPLVIADGQAITQKDLNNAFQKYYRNSALKLIIRRILIDHQAQQYGVSVTDNELDAALDRWKQQNFGDSPTAYNKYLQKLGASPALNRELFRQELIAQKIVDKTTVLVDSDFDKVVVHPLYMRNLQDARTVYQGLMNGEAINDIMLQDKVDVQLPPATTILRYDTRLGLNTKAGADLFALKRGGILYPLPWNGATGYVVLIVTDHISGQTLSGPDRQVWADSLLTEKRKWLVQDWMDNLEQQAQTAVDGSAPSSQPLPAGNP